MGLEDFWLSRWGNCFKEGKKVIKYAWLYEKTTTFLTKEKRKLKTKWMSQKLMLKKQMKQVDKKEKFNLKVNQIDIYLKRPVWFP